MHLAAQHHEVAHADIVTLLLEHNADPGLQDHEGGTSLHTAVEQRHAEHLERILNGKNNHVLDSHDGFGRTALFKTVRELQGDYSRMTRALLKAGSDASKPDNSGQTALHYANATPDNGLNHAFLDDGRHFDEMVSISIRCGHKVSWINHSVAAKVGIENDVGQTPHEIALASEA